MSLGRLVSRQHVGQYNFTGVSHNNMPEVGIVRSTQYVWALTVTPHLRAQLCGSVCANIQMMIKVVISNFMRIRSESGDV